MLRLVLLFIAVGASLAPAADPIRQVRLQRKLAPPHILPNFDNRYLVAFESGGIAVYGPDGRLACRIRDHTTIPGSCRFADCRHWPPGSKNGWTLRPAGGSLHRPGGQVFII